MRPVVLTLVFLATFVVAATAGAPLSIVLNLIEPERYGVSYARAEGRVWNGVARDVSAFGQPIGDIAVRARPWRLARGALAATVTVSGPAMRGEADVAIGVTGRATARDASLTVDLSRLERLSRRLRQAGGAARITLDEAVLTPSACVLAEGRIWTDMLARGPSERWRGPALEGPIDCADGRLRLALVGAEGPERVDLFAAIGLDLRYTLEVEVVTQDGRAGAFLPLMGFERVGPAYVYGRDSSLAG